MQFQRMVCGTVAALAVMLACVPAYAGRETPRYDYSMAVEEIAQLFWLAETANTCGWATRAEADAFEKFAVRFLTAHLSGTHRSALVSFISEGGFLPGVQRAAHENRALNCEQARWRNGWATFKAAADENESRY